MLVLDMIYADWIVKKKKKKSTNSLRCLSHALDPLGFGAWHIVFLIPTVSHIDFSDIVFNMVFMSIPVEYVSIKYQ